MTNIRVSSGKKKKKKGGDNISLSLIISVLFGEGELQIKSEI